MKPTLLLTLLALGCARADTASPGESPPPAPFVGIAYVALAPDQAAVVVGDTIRVRLVDTNLPRPVSVVWSVSDRTLAGVDATGLVTAFSPGSVGVAATVSGARGTAAGAVTLRIGPPPSPVR